ncbi:MAG: putative Ig domain-containing protein, partial [Paludibacter sp.]
MKKALITALFLAFLGQINAQTSSTSTVPNAPNAYILTPPSPATPRINGPKVFGVRPGSLFLYSIPVTGERPMKFEVISLPSGLKLDAESGRITGILKKSGTYKVTLQASNKKGKAKKLFRIVVGDQIQLTPAMGWNSWNCWGAEVSQENVLSSARAFVEKGLSNHGWSFVNIDDGWQGMRSGKYNGILGNSKFPNMKALADSIHGMGLKFGIYSTPWRGSYLGHIGSYSDNEDGSYDWIKAGNHNQYYKIGPTNDSIRKIMRQKNLRFGRYSFVKNDVKQWVDWGVDYLKYDWYINDTSHVAEMSKVLQSQSRDVVFSLSNKAPFEGAASWAKLSNCWRITGDINDSWKSMTSKGFGQDKWAPFCSPGHFNDPDMLVVGYVGWGTPHPTKLTPDEQYTHISLWCLLSAPLLIGCDLSRIDDFTLSLLTNDEVLEIDQDALCKQGVRVDSQPDLDVFIKPLEDGSLA